MGAAYELAFCVLTIFIATAYGETRKHATFPKCCPSGESLSSDGCEHSDLPFTLDFADKTPPFYEIVNGTKCEHGRYRVEPNEDDTKEFHLFSNGSIKLSLNDTEEHRPHQYCLESFLLDDGRNKVLLLLCFPPEFLNTESSTAWFNPIGCLVSIPFLLLTMGAYLMAGKLKSMHGKILVVYWLCLSISYGCLYFLITNMSSTDLGCKLLGFLTHLFLLLSFFWLNVFCFHTWKSVARGDAMTNEKKELMWYAVYAVGCPSIILAVSLAIDFSPIASSSHPMKPNIGLESCWFQENTAPLYVYVVGPIIILLIANFVFFFFTIFHLIKKKSEGMGQSIGGKVPQVTLNRRRQIYIQGIFLFIAMGLNWVLEFAQQIAYSKHQENTLLIFRIVDVFNSLYGVMSFFVFVLLDDRVRRLVLDKLCFRRRYLIEERRESVSSDAV